MSAWRQRVTRRSGAVCAGLVLVVALISTGCAYPRRTTSLAPATDANTAAIEYPEHLWRLEILECVIPPRQRSGLPWDDPEDPEDGPDAYVRVLRNDKVLYETPVRHDVHHATFAEIVPGNLYLPPTKLLQLEVWDADERIVGTDDPIGVWRNRGLPANAVPDGDLRLRMDSGVTLIVRVLHPRPFRGVGVETYEVRGNGFRILEVIENSPAGRADIRPDDTIVAIEGRPVAAMDEADAATAFSLAAERGSTLTVERGGENRDLVLDDGYVWPTR